MNLQAIASPDKDILWVSGPLPGVVHDLTAARIWAIAASWPSLACSCWTTRATSRGGHRTPAAQEANRAHCQAPCARRARQRSAQVPAHPARATAAAPGESGGWTRPSTSLRYAKSEGERPTVSVEPSRIEGTSDYCASSLGSSSPISVTISRNLALTASRLSSKRGRPPSRCDHNGCSVRAALIARGTHCDSHC